MKAFVIAMQFPQYVGYLKGLTKNNMPLWDKSVTAAKMFTYEELAKRELDAVFMAKPDYLQTMREVFDDEPGKKTSLYIMEVVTSPIFVFTDDEVTKRMEFITNERLTNVPLVEELHHASKERVGS